METFDPQKLAEQNGREGKKSYVAVDGKVYDVTDSKRWKNGKHMLRHNAGADLTTEIKAAPHGAEVFERVTQIGALTAPQEDTGPHIPWPLSWLYRKFPVVKRHAHPVAVHFPLAFTLGSALFFLLYLLMHDHYFAHTSLHLIVLAVVTAPIAMLTGFQSWWLYYGLKPTRGILIKIFGAFVLVMLGVTAALLFGFVPLEVQVAHSALAYLALVLIASVLALIIGAIGGQMTFPD
jgi:predicted heme/steroid binding protein/uncharacterized membrane protein